VQLSGRGLRRRPACGPGARCRGSLRNASLFLHPRAHLEAGQGRDVNHTVGFRESSSQIAQHAPRGGTCARYLRDSALECWTTRPCRDPRPYPGCCAARRGGRRGRSGGGKCVYRFGRCCKTRERPARSKLGPCADPEQASEAELTRRLGRFKHCALKHTASRHSVEHHVLS
jgi:hypothetical protein